MKFKALALVGALAFAGSANANILWNQPFDGSGNAFASQNDTNGFGNYATVYDNFTLSAPATLTDITVTGEYFNPPSQGAITGWTVSLYADAAGQPGAQVATGTFPNNETFLGTFGGFPTYTYDFATSFAAAAGTYWLAVVPDLGFPPQWGWSTGTGGDGISYQDFFGTRSQLATDLAFTISGGASVPEPAAWALMLVGFGGLGLAMRSRRRTAAAAA